MAVSIWMDLQAMSGVYRSMISNGLTMMKSSQIVQLQAVLEKPKRIEWDQLQAAQEKPKRIEWDQLQAV